MLKYIRGRGSHLSAERLKQQKDLFNFSETNHHGFPYKPTCMAYDNVLSLLAIGTRDGSIYIVGRAGVELSAVHENTFAVRNIYFLEGRAQLITVTEDHTIHLWEINSKSKSIEQTDEHKNTDDKQQTEKSVAEAATTKTEEEITAAATTEEEVAAEKDGDEKLNENAEEIKNEFKYSFLEKVKFNDSFSKDKRETTAKDITTLSICLENNLLYIGTTSGNVYILDLLTLEQTDQVIYQDVAIQTITSSPITNTTTTEETTDAAVNAENSEKNENEPQQQQQQQQRVNPGPVEIIITQPNKPDKVLIGYQKGLIVLWDNKNLMTERTFTINQQLESIHWQSSGEKFISAHNDGSHIIWHVGNELRLPLELQKTIYGPFPCKPIPKVIWKTIKNDEDLLIFSGGMPRAAHGDKHTVSIIQGSPETGKHHVLELTSKIVDFIVVDEKDGDFDNSKALLILAEEELIAIDLRDPDWLQFRLPYFCSVHSSAITCNSYYRNVPNDIIEKLINAENEKSLTKYTNREWPITGGEQVLAKQSNCNDLLITGHEDGGIRFWLTGDNNKLNHLYTLTTSKLFISMDDDIAPIDGDDIPLDEADGTESEWPPFRKVGVYDPFSDDVRLAIRKIIFSPQNENLIAAGTAGQVIIFELKDEKIEKPLSTVSASIVNEADGFVWKGCNKLIPTNGNMKFDQGFQPKTIVQLSPPASVTALTECTKWSLLAAGTSHGFVLYDLLQSKVVFVQRTIKVIEPENAASPEEVNSSVSRRRSFRKSLRESFRRLRKRRSQSAEKASDPSTSPSSSSPAKESGTKSPIKSDIDVSESIDKRRTVERSLTMKVAEDVHPSVVRCLHFSLACLSNNNPEAATLWVGINSGLIYVFALTMPADDKRNEDEVTCKLAKEIQLKHKAPVIYIQVLDAKGKPTTITEQAQNTNENSESNEQTTTTTTVTNSAYALICSEEQFKLFSLPTFKPYCKSKITVHNVAKVRTVNIAEFISKTDVNHTEHSLTALVNDGKLVILTLPDLRKQIQTKLLDGKDTNGICSALLLDNGNGIYMKTLCQYQYFTLSACLSKQLCYSFINIPENTRPVIEISKTALIEQQSDSVALESDAAAAAATSAAAVENTSEDKKKDGETKSPDVSEKEMSSKKEKKAEKEKKPEKEKKSEKKEKEKKAEKIKEKKTKKADKEKETKKETKEKKENDDNKNNVDENEELTKDENAEKSVSKEEKSAEKDDEKIDVAETKEKTDTVITETSASSVAAVKSEVTKEVSTAETMKTETSTKTTNGIDEKQEPMEVTSTAVTVTKITEKIEQLHEQKTSTPLKSVKASSQTSTETTKTTIINGSNEKNGLLDSSVISDITDTNDMSLDSVKDYMLNLTLNDSTDIIKEKDVVKEDLQTQIINTNED